MRLYELPETWRWVKLGNITEIIGGGTPSRSNKLFFEGSLPWATPTDITALDNLWISETSEYITEEALNNSSAKLLPTGAVLMTSRATIGATAITTREMTTNQGFANFVCDDRVLLNEYLAYYLPSIKEWLIHIAGGTTFKEISKRVLATVDIPLPTLIEQHRIVSLLRQADELYRKRNKAIHLYDMIPRSVFASVFGSYGDWRRTAPITKYAEIVGGGTPSRKNKEFFTGDIPWITPKDMGKRYIDDSKEHITEDAIENSATKLVPADKTILMVVKSKILAHTLPVGIATIKCSFNQDIKGIICDDDIDPLFILGAIQAQEQRILNQARGANTEGLTLEILRNIQIPVSSPKRLKQFSEAILSYDILVNRVSTANIKVDSLVEVVINNSFTGDVTTLWRETRLEQLKEEAVKRDILLGLRGEKPTIGDYEAGRVTEAEREEIERMLAESIKPLLENMSRTSSIVGESIQALQRRHAEQMTQIVESIKIPQIYVQPIYSTAITNSLARFQQQMSLIAETNRKMIQNMTASMQPMVKQFNLLLERIATEIDEYPPSDHPRYDIASKLSRQQKFLFWICENQETHFTVESIQEKTGLSTDVIRRALDLFASLGLILPVSIQAQSSAGDVFTPAFRCLKVDDEVLLIDLDLLEEGQL